MIDHAVVISAGDWMYGDDAAGVIVANELRRRLGDAIRVSYDPGIVQELVCADGSSPVRLIALLATIPQQEGQPAGSWWRLDCRENLTSGQGCCLGVNCSLSLTSLQSLADRLPEVNTALWVYAIAGEDFHLGAPLSFAVTRALGEFTAQIESDIRRELGLQPADSSRPLTAALL